MLVLDAHAHCGLTLPLARLYPLWQKAGIDGGVLFAPVEEIYDRYNRQFIDSPEYQESREKVHAYIKSLVARHIFVYWFVWNDFALPADGFTGIKWHRHANEPLYKYDTKECQLFIDHICHLRMPIIIEDELHRTLDLVNRIKGRTVVIIPHFGYLNGGYFNLKQAGLFEHPSVYVDTALAERHEMADFAADYGVDRILFGSDFPFGDPAYELHKVEQVFANQAKVKVLAENLLALLGRG